ncbi:MAG: DUF892 family protein [Bdellovibrionota bacterium]
MGLAEVFHAEVLRADIRSLRDVFIDELKDLMSAEEQLVRALPLMAERATNPRLKDVFFKHADETKNHVLRLERIGTILKERLAGQKCNTMASLIAEGDDTTHQSAGASGDVLIDSLLVGDARKVEHHEIAAYENACALAARLEETEVLAMLQETLREELLANDDLRLIREEEILPAAYEPSSDRLRS